MTRETGSNRDTRAEGCSVLKLVMARSMKISDPVLQDLVDYWERLRDGGEVPYRSEIDPRQFEYALEDMFILEDLGNGNVRIRLAGMHLCELMGMELRGMSVRALMRPEHRNAFDGALSQVLRDPAVGCFDLIAFTPTGRKLRAAMILLPLRNDFGDVARILGCLRVHGDVAEGGPLRFAIEEAQLRQVPVRQNDPETRQALPGFAEPQASFEPEPPKLRTIEGGAAKPGQRRRNHLRLVDKK